MGQWVIAEGAIYDMFDTKKNVYKKLPFDINDINICCDYGVSTVTSFGVMGIHKDETDGNTYCLMEETYYDKEEVIRKRLDTYHDVTAKLKPYYEAQGKLVTAYGKEKLEDTIAEVDAAMSKIQ